MAGERNGYREICAILPPELASVLGAVSGAVQKTVREIRLRTGQPVQLHLGERSVFIGTGTTAPQPDRTCHRLTQKEIEAAFRALCGYAVHTHQNEIKNGFIALKGGHRAGIGGTGVYIQNELNGIREISSVSIRIAHEVPGAADEVLRRWQNPRQGLLIAGPPASGKTTILRDLIRQMASGHAGEIKKVAVIDERGEIAAAVGGDAQNDIGFTTDILSGVLKSDGILMAVRTLSPHYIFCDEIGREEELQPIAQAISSGVGVVATIHAASFADILRKPLANKMLANGFFDTVAVLADEKHTGEILQWLDREEIEDEMVRFNMRGAGLHRGWSVRGIQNIPAQKRAGADARFN